MSFFLPFLLDAYDDPWEGQSYGWYGRAEKSRSAVAREKEATRKFVSLRKLLVRAPVIYKERLIRLGCMPESWSPFRLLPEVIVSMILEYARPNDFAAHKASRPSLSAKNASSDRSQKKNPKKSAACREADLKVAGALLGSYLDVEGLNDPGKKHFFRLLTPNDHLTGPCWRDFSREVRYSTGWKPKRVEATPQQKKTFGIHRQGRAYFVYVIYTVPGTPRKKPKAAKIARTESHSAQICTTSTAGMKRSTPPDAVKGATTKRAKRVVGPTAEREEASVASMTRPPLIQQQPPPLPQSMPGRTHAAVFPLIPPAVPAFDRTDPRVAARMEAARRAAGYVLPGERGAGGTRGADGGSDRREGKIGAVRGADCAEPH